MRRAVIIVLLLAALALQLQRVGFFSHDPSARERAGLRGPVRELVQYQLFTAGFDHLLPEVRDRYDQDGNLVLHEDYGIDGQPLRRVERILDHGRLVEERHYHRAKLVRRIETHYDAAGAWSRDDEFNGAGKLQRTRRLAGRVAVNLQEIADFYSRQFDTESWARDYDAIGTKTTILVENAAGGPAGLEIRITDRDDRLLLHSKTDNPSLPGNATLNVYDRQGRLLRQTELRKGQLYSTLYYRRGEDGGLLGTSRILHGSDGNPLSQEDVRFNALGWPASRRQMEHSGIARQQVATTYPDVDDHGNWTRREERQDSRLRITTRRIEYE